MRIVDAGSSARGRRPELVACMHGSAFRGNCGELLQRLADTVG